MIQFYVNDLSKLGDFGFFYKSGYYRVITHRATNVYVEEKTGRMTIQSPSKEMILIICKMYEKGLIDVFDDNEPEAFIMKVTKDEMNMIYERRKDKKNERV